jgi:alkyl hydroperoxide reductase subunit F
VKIISDKNEIFYAKAMIIATGAKWKKLNIAGESEHIGKGVAFCPHCDGPLFAGKNVTVVGGGNSGIEAAIDLSAICKSVTVVEFLDELKADSVLQEKAKNIKNISIFTSTQTTEIVGDTQKVTAIIVKNRKNDEVRELKTDGVFVQIGLTPNSDVFKDLVNTNKFGEIIIDEHCRTSSPHIYAAGDVSTVPYTQIIISMGEGAKAALTMSEELN